MIKIFLVLIVFFIIFVVFFAWREDERGVNSTEEDETIKKTETGLRRKGPADAFEGLLYQQLRFERGLGDFD